MKATLFIIHGWAYDIAKWQPFMQFLTARGMDVKLLHVPGLTTEPLKEAWGIDDYVSWLDSEIGKKPAILLGHSNGGRIALNYALKYPEKVTQLILLDSAGIPRRELKARIKKGVLKTLAKGGKLVTKSPKARGLLYKIARERDYYNADPVMRETMANLLASDNNLEPAGIKIPTHIIWGREDQATPLKDAYSFQKAIKGSDVHIIDGARHSPQFTHAGQTAAIVSEVTG